MPSRASRGRPNLAARAKREMSWMDTELEEWLQLQKWKDREANADLIDNIVILQGVGGCVGNLEACIFCFTTC